MDRTECQGERKGTEGRIIGKEYLPLIVELNIVPIYLVADLFVNFCVGTSSVHRREPGSDGCMGDVILAGWKLIPKGLGVGDEPLLGFTISLVDGVHVLLIGED